MSGEITHELAAGVGGGTKAAVLPICGPQRLGGRAKGRANVRVNTVGLLATATVLLGCGGGTTVVNEPKPEQRTTTTVPAPPPGGETETEIETPDGKETEIKVESETD
jgi:hypothetical protein